MNVGLVGEGNSLSDNLKIIIKKNHTVKQNVGDK